MTPNEIVLLLLREKRDELADLAEYLEGNGNQPYYLNLELAAINAEINRHLPAFRDPETALRRLKDQGLTFGTCSQVFAASTSDEMAYVAAASDQYHRDGEIEIDGGAVVSTSDDHGAYVQAWVWVEDNSVWDGPVDIDNEPCRFVNHYACDDCDQEWAVQWSCTCDDECSGCGKSYTPHESIELDLLGNPYPEV